MDEMEEEAMRRAAYAVLDRAETAADQARRDEDQLIRDAISEAATLPDHYWQARWRAEQKLNAARALVASFR